MKRLPIALLLLSPALPWLHAQDIIRTETTEVLVDVSVTDHKDGARVPLEAKDFSIWEDNKPQKINSVSSVASDSDASQKHFVFFLDLNGMGAEDQAETKRVAAAFVDGLASPDRYMGVVSWNGGNPIVLQNFTTAKEVLKKAITTPSSNLIRLPTSMGASIATICESMAKGAGRKVIFLFTATPNGFDKTTYTVCNRANVAVDMIVVRFGSPAFGVADAAWRVARGPVAPMGVVTPGALQVAKDVAETMAKETGGQAFALSQALDQQLAAVARQQDEYYRVAYTPPPAKEGSCHTLKVTTTAHGADVRARREYCTEKPIDLVAGKIAGQALESRAGKGNLTAVMQLPFFYTGTHRAAVHLVAEIVPTGMKFEKDKAGFHGQIDVVGTVLRADGGVAARFADTVNIDQPDQQHADAFTKTTYRYEHQFTAMAGTYTFQLALGAGPNAVAKLEAPLSIEPRSSSAFGVSSIAMTPEARPVAPDDASEGLVLEGKGPLTAAGRAFAPSATNRFRRGGPVYFYMEVYAPITPEAAVLRFRILDRKTGEPKVDSGLGSISGFVRPGNPVIPVATRLNVTELPVGSYRLEVRAASSQAAAPSTRSLDFELE